MYPLHYSSSITTIRYLLEKSYYVYNCYVLRLVEDQILLEEEERKKQEAAKQKTKEPKQRHCRKCGNPTLGHPRGVCPIQQNEQQPDS